MEDLEHAKVHAYYHQNTFLTVLIIYYTTLESLPVWRRAAIFSVPGKTSTTLTAALIWLQRLSHLGRQRAEKTLRGSLI